MGNPIALVAPLSAILLNPVVLPSLPYDPDKDLLPVAQVGAAGGTGAAICRQLRSMSGWFQVSR
ncbi:hypothetical protein LMG26685_01483 [Achromobacter mucicolens]|uniref:hypothetical protein n=1 Tax=Achromobacter mucicolens TaxID=1389922 RepID=UPI0009CC65CA|nr:hypothetical protein BMR85_003725 [Achromobacter sp. KAs 3-5]CAB3635242.1 hypothetical protein LMG26685_01483 [Achromobacter mucicolens]